MPNILPAKVVSSGRYIAACCPFCSQFGKSADDKFHLYILKNAWAYCYRCGHKSSYDWLISNYTLNLCNSYQSIVVPKSSNFDDYITCHTGNFNDSQYSKSALKYLSNRKIPQKLIDNLNIKLGKDEMFGRVVFVDAVNQYYMGRAFLPFVNPKTMNPVGNLKPLMYFDKNRIDTLHLVEGVFDSIPFIKTNMR